MRESLGKLVLAGAVPPHHHIGGDSCLGAIDQDPVDTFGARVDHKCPGWADAYIYILAAVGGTFALLILICVVGRHYVKKSAINWAQRKNNQVENGSKSMELCYQRSSAPLEQA